jgi:NAD(P)-dependent dehydrogenase (short-subunit alcohol dehydrogenase family)
MRMGIFIMASTKTVLVVGGKGGLSQHYRDAVAEEGYELLHFENKLPAKGRHGLGKAALVVVMVSMISHALAQQVRELTPTGASVVFLKSPSVSALRAAVSGHGDAGAES